MLNNDDSDAHVSCDSVCCISNTFTDHRDSPGEAGRGPHNRG
jgi:hypothetical protein